MKRLLIICHEERDDACTCHGEMMACGKVHLHRDPPAFPEWMREFFEKLDTEEPPEDLMEWV